MRRLLLLSMILCSAVRVQAACPFTFLPQTSYPAGSYAGDVASGDFNKDGYLDLVVVNRQSDKVAVLLGAAGATFGTPTFVTVGHTQGDIAVSDVNSDGNLDFVVAVEGWINSVKVFLGTGSGTFNLGDEDTVGQNPDRIDRADFNKDGLLDFAISRNNPAGFSLLIAQATGGIVTKSENDVLAPNDYSGSYVSALASGDFDADGNRDVAAVDTHNKTLWLFWGNGDGTFVKANAAISMTTPQSHDPYMATAEDFNGDGRADLAVGYRDAYNGGVTPQIAVLMSGAASRTFAAPIMYGSAPVVGEIVANDIDADGDADLLFGAGGDVSVLKNFGDGTFGDQVSYGNIGTFGLAIGDFDGDGGPDVAATDFGNGNVVILLAACGRPNLNFTSSANPSSAGTGVTLTATLTSSPAATGTLTISQIGGPTLASGNLNASTTISTIVTNLEPGTYQFVATYSGDSRFAAVTKTIKQTVQAPPFGPPPRLSAIGSATGVNLSWLATSGTSHYEVWRGNGAGYVYIGSSQIAAFSDQSAPAGSALLYQVRAIAADSTASTFSAPDLAITHAFTDESITAGVTRVKLAHLTELRSAANSARTVVGLAPMTWAEPAPSLIRASHITELRAAINAARTSIGLASSTFSDSTLAAGTAKVRAAHLMELRASLR